MVILYWLSGLMVEVWGDWIFHLQQSHSKNIQNGTL